MFRVIVRSRRRGLVKVAETSNGVLALTLILAIAAEVGRPLAIDDFTDNLKKIGYARVMVELDASILLKHGVLIQEKKGHFW